MHLLRFELNVCSMQIVVTQHFFLIGSFFYITRANEAVINYFHIWPNVSDSFFSSWASAVCPCYATTAFWSLKANHHHLGSCRCGKNSFALTLSLVTQRNKTFKITDTGKERPLFSLCSGRKPVATQNCMYRNAL